MVPKMQAKGTGKKPEKPLKNDQQLDQRIRFPAILARYLIGAFPSGLSGACRSALIGEALISTSVGMPSSKRLSLKRSLFGCAIVVPKNLLIEITKKMEWFNINVGSFESAVYETPKVLKPIRVILFR